MKARFIYNPITNNIIMFVGTEANEKFIVITEDNSIYDQLKPLIN